MSKSAVSNHCVGKLGLWNQVEKTDPRYTKPFNRSGGFRGTAVNSTYLARRATEVFGPMGIGWGVDILDEEILEGAPLDAQGNHEKIHKVRVKLWYVFNGERGEVKQFGQTTFVGRNKNGFFTDEEAPKKSLTDAMGKCLSLLGFSADIHLGLYDDNKYVAELQKEFAEKADKGSNGAEAPAEAEADTPVDGRPRRRPASSSVQHVLNRVKKASAEDIDKAEAWARSNIQDRSDLAKVLQAIENRKAELSANAVVEA